MRKKEKKKKERKNIRKLYKLMAQQSTSADVVGAALWCIAISLKYNNLLFCREKDIEGFSRNKNEIIWFWS